MSPNLRKDPEPGSPAWQRQQLEKRMMAATQPGGLAATPQPGLEAVPPAQATVVVNAGEVPQPPAPPSPSLEAGILQNVDLGSLFDRLSKTSWKTMEGQLTWIVSIVGILLFAGAYVLIYQGKSTELANDLMVYATILVSGGQVVGVGGRTIVKTILGLVARAALTPSSQNKDTK